MEYLPIPGKKKNHSTLLNESSFHSEESKHCIFKIRKHASIPLDLEHVKTRHFPEMVAKVLCEFVKSDLHFPMQNVWVCLFH